MQERGHHDWHLPERHHPRGQQDQGCRAPSQPGQPSKPPTARRLLDLLTFLSQMLLQPLYMDSQVSPTAWRLLDLLTFPSEMLLQPLYMDIFATRLPKDPSTISSQAFRQSKIHQRDREPLAAVSSVLLLQRLQLLHRLSATWCVHRHITSVCCLRRQATGLIVQLKPPHPPPPPRLLTRQT